MTKNELIVESCRNMAFQDLRDTLSAALDDRDATIAELREDRRVLGGLLQEVCVKANGRSGGSVYMIRKELMGRIRKATDASGALERANG